MNIYTYHDKRSSGMGGIETLYRSLHIIGRSLGATCTELYSESEAKEDVYFDVDESIISHRIPSLFYPAPYFDSFFKSIMISFYFIFRKVQNGDIFVCIDPRVILFVPSFVLSRLKVVIVQSSRFDIIYGRIAKMVIKIKWRKISAFTVYTEVDKEALLKLFPCIEEKVHVIPRGCKLKTSKRVKIKTNQLVTIARISPEKNLNIMIDIVLLLNDSFKLNIYGVGSKKNIALLQEKIKGNERFKFKGAAVDLYKIFETSSVFLMTSTYEGFGQTLIEARSQGLPLVAFDTFDALSSIIDDGVNGFRVTPFNKKDFAKKIELLLSDDEVYQEFSRNASVMAGSTENGRILVLWESLFLKLSN